MPGPDEVDLLRVVNGQLARQVGQLTAQKLKMAMWLAQCLLAAGGKVALSGEPPALEALHLMAEHRCSGIGHGPECKQVLELHPGMVETCPDEACQRLSQQPEDAPGLRTLLKDVPSPDPQAGSKSFQEQMLRAQAWQHPERN